MFFARAGGHAAPAKGRTNTLPNRSIFSLLLRSRLDCHQNATMSANGAAGESSPRAGRSTPAPGIQARIGTPLRGICAQWRRGSDFAQKTGSNPRHGTRRISYFATRDCSMMEIDAKPVAPILGANAYSSCSAPFVRPIARSKRVFFQTRKSHAGHPRNPLPENDGVQTRRGGRR